MRAVRMMQERKGISTAVITRVGVVVVVVAMVVTAGIITSTYFGAATTVTRTSTFIISLTATTTLILPCSGQQVWNNSETAYAYSRLPVLLMRPNSTAYICVVYQSGWKGNASMYQNLRDLRVDIGTYQFRLLVIKEHCTTTGGNTTCTPPTISHSFIISAYPSSIRPAADTNRVSVLYVVTALANSTGFYDGSAPYDYCDRMPMAVGYTASQVNASDFAVRYPIPCPALLFSPSSVSVAGMNVTYV